MKISSFAEAFIKESFPQKLASLSMMPPQHRVRIFEEWADSCTITEVVQLHKEDKGSFFEMERTLCGHPKTNRRPTSREFYIGPNPDFKYKASAEGHQFEAAIETSMIRNKRSFLAFDKPKKVSAAHAIAALLNYGMDSPVGDHRGALIELSEDDYLDWQIQQRGSAKTSSKKGK